MRIIALSMCGSIALLVFLTTLLAIARHRARQCPDRACVATAIAEYAWAVIPWLMIVACALPAARLMMFCDVPLTSTGAAAGGVWSSS